MRTEDEMCTNLFSNAAINRYKPTINQKCVPIFWFDIYRQRSANKAKKINKRRTEI